jgi:hypothetical protein
MPAQDFADLIKGDIDDAFAAWGSDDARRADAALVLAPRCERRGNVTVLRDTNTAINTPQARDWIAQTRPHLLPPEHETSLADRAFVQGNVTARGQLARELNIADLDRLAQSYGLRDHKDFSKGTRPNGNGGEHKPKPDRENPWSREGFNLTRQGQLVRAMGLEKAAAMARAAGSYIGATKPPA